MEKHTELWSCEPRENGWFMVSLLSHGAFSRVFCTFGAIDDFKAAVIDPARAQLQEFLAS
jgi:hypothetical protein